MICVVHLLIINFNVSFFYCVFMFQLMLTELGVFQRAKTYVKPYVKLNLTLITKTSSWGRSIIHSSKVPTTNRCDSTTVHSREPTSLFGFLIEHRQGVSGEWVLTAGRPHPTVFTPRNKGFSTEGSLLL